MSRSTEANHLATSVYSVVYATVIFFDPNQCWALCWELETGRSRHGPSSGTQGEKDACRQFEISRGGGSKSHETINSSELSLRQPR